MPANASLEKSPQLEVTLFSSSFCGACTQTKHVLDEVLPLLGGRVGLSEINVASDPDAAESFEIIATPTVVLTDANGVELARASGVPSANQVLATLARHL
jgi:thioredoxin-like negative regulator of GroEL